MIGNFYTKHGKGYFDFFLAVFTLFLSLPIFLIISLVIKLNSKGPVIYKQKRLKKYGEEFTFYKFRTMVENAEKNGPVWFVDEKDERVTTIGRILRNTNLDELPQIINILKGDMSFVGPRPERPCFHKDFSEKFENWDKRLEVKPGLTGLAVLHGYYGDTSIEKRLEYDLKYIRNISFSMDLKILFRTII